MGQTKNDFLLHDYWLGTKVVRCVCVRVVSKTLNIFVEQSVYKFKVKGYLEEKIQTTSNVFCLKIHTIAIQKLSKYKHIDNNVVTSLESSNWLRNHHTEFRIIKQFLHALISNQYHL